MAQAPHAAASMVDDEVVSGRLQVCSFSFARAAMPLLEADAFLSGFEQAATILLATWCALLFRRSDQEARSIDLLTPGNELWSRLALPTRVSASTTVSELLGIARELMNRAALASVGDVPAEHRTGFACVAQNDPKSAAFSAPSLKSNPALRCDMHLLCAVGEHTVECTLVYARELFDGDMARQIADQYENLLTSFRASSPVPVSSLALLTAAQQQALRQRWSGPKQATEFRPVFSAIDGHAQQRPNDVAVLLGEGRQTYGSLQARSRRFASWLLARGLKRGDRVALCISPNIDVVACMVGILRAGGVYVPLEPSYPIERLALMIDDTQPLVVVAEHESEKKLAGVNAQVVLLETLQSTLSEDPTTPGSEQVSVELAPDDTAYIVYTSGTTGRPKGVMVSHRNLEHYVRVACDAYGYRSSDVIPAMARFTFSITFFELLCPVVAGASLVLLERGRVLDMPAMLQTLRQVTCIHASPSLWRKLVLFIDEQGLNHDNFPNIRHASSGGDMVPPDVLESLKRVFPSAEVFVIYGCSEVSCMGCTYPVPRDRTLTSTRVGKPFPNMAVRLLDTASNIVPPGVLGEVCFTGEGVAKGYLNAPEQTARQFIELAGERLYRTGDVGRFDRDGNLELVGRSDFQIKLRGFRIEPAEIEATLRTLKGIKDALVAAPVQDDGERRLVAYLVLDPAATPSAGAIREHLKGKLPDYMVPAALVELNALPVNVNNKVDRLALANAPPTLGKPLGSGVAPRTESERRLLGIWETVLRTPGIGVQDEFFDVGGDSLRSVALMAEIDKQLGVSLPVSILLTEPTIERLAAWIDGGRTADDTAATLVCLRKGDDSRPPIFFIHDGDGESMPYRNVAQELPKAHSVYGVHPKSTRHHPMLHTRLAEMVTYFVEQIRQVQPTGPYFVGGLCIGGFLAFEVARRLRQQGQEVGPVFLIDVAHVTTPAKSSAARRLNRIQNSLGDIKQQKRGSQLLAMGQLLARRAVNMIAYEARSRSKRRLTRSKIQLFRLCLDQGFAIPSVLRSLSVDSILRFAEKEYVVPAPFPGDIVLMRATARDDSLDDYVDDTPYIDLFQDPMLGWEGKAAHLTTHDIRAGHSSMLREPHARQVADLIRGYVERALAKA
jgi:amino acid adenylation domain-containing protein